MPALLDVLRGRMKARELNAIDTIAAAARAAARGDAYDIGSIEAALVEARLSADDFEKAVAQASRRAGWLNEFDKLAAAASKLKKLEAAAAAEEAKFEEQRRIFAEKFDAMNKEATAARSARDAGEQARGKLLDPKDVPGTIGEKYRAAVAEAEAASAAVGNLQRELREVRERMKSEEEWIVQLVGESSAKLGPYSPLKQSGVVPESYKLDDHRRALARAQRRLAEIEAELKTAEQLVTKTRRAVDDLIPDVLKA